MNKLKKQILSKGKFIDCGTEREAFLYNNKVWKITKAKTKQNHKEREVLDKIKELNLKLNIMPNIKYINNSISVCDEYCITPLEDKDFRQYIQIKYSNTHFSTVQEYIEFLSLYNRINNAEEIYKELDILKQLGVTDIDNNLGNVGYCNGKIKIIDFGSFQ